MSQSIHADRKAMPDLVALEYALARHDMERGLALIHSSESVVGVPFRRAGA